jgi:hypothetical protein
MVSGVASVWAVASPLSQGCAAAAVGGQTGPSPSEAQAFVVKVNELRASKGLSTLTVDGNLAAIAQDWSAQMAAAHAISHRSDLSSGVTSNWRRLGENVGVGPDVDALMAAFIASPAHYANLVDPSFTHIGVGTFRTAEGLIYTAHEFAYVKTSAPAPVAAPTAAAPAVSAPAPRPASPQVTAAPTPPTTAAPTTTTAPPTTVAHAAAPQATARVAGVNHNTAAPTHHATHATCNG